MERVLRELYRIRFPAAGVAAYLIVGDGGLTLVDSGMPRRADRILSGIRELRRRPSDLMQIAVTHRHVDHIGSLASVVAATNATVYAHRMEAPAVRQGGEGPRGQPTPPYGRLILPVTSRLLPSRGYPVTVDRELEDGEELPVQGGLEAIHTPGHTPGHLSFLWGSHGGVLFVGDAAAHAFGRVDLNYVNLDIQQAKQSFRRLAALDFQIACFGHGRVIKGGAVSNFRRVVDRLSG